VISSSQPSLSRFIGALLLAPMAGGAAGFVATFSISLFGDRQNWKDAVTASSLIGFWALIICCVYVLIVGTVAYVYARMTQRTLSLAVAMIVGIVTGVVPFAIASFMEEGATFLGAMAFPALAAVCAVATAWTFWRLALAPGASARESRAAQS
jgi:uncharacterized membrane protein